MNKENNNCNENNNRLIPLNDHAFKKMFGSEGCEPQLMTLINGLTGRTGEQAVKNITIQENEIPRELYGDKQIKLDIIAKTDKGEQFNIEAQIKNVDMKPRSVYYTSKLLNKSVKKGEDYSKMNEVIMITIFGSTSKERDNYKGYYKHDKINEYSEKYEFNLPKFDKLKEKDLNNPQHRCLMFLSHNTDEKMRKKVIKMEPNLAKAQEIMDYINSSPKEIELYEMRELVKMDTINARKNDLQEGKEEGIKIGEEKGKQEGIEIGEEKGMKKGIEIGKQEGIEIGEEKGMKKGIEIGEEKGIEKGMEKVKIEFAIKMINEGFSVEDIVKITGLSLEFIKKL